MKLIGRKHILGNNYKKIIIDETSGNIKCYQFKENPNYKYYGEKHDVKDISYLVNSYLDNHTLLVIKPKCFIKGKYYIELISESGIIMDLCLLNTESNNILVKNIINKYIIDRYNIINKGNYSSINISKSYDESSAYIVDDVLNIKLINNSINGEIMDFERYLLDYLIDDNYKYRYEHVNGLYIKKIVERNGRDVSTNNEQILFEINKRITRNYVNSINDEYVQLKLDMKGSN